MNLYFISHSHNVTAKQERVGISAQAMTITPV